MAERVGAIVVGAGGGRRMGGIDKAFLPLLDRPLISHSVSAFEYTPDVHDICLVISRASVEASGELARREGWLKVRAIVVGGAERQDSVRTGLDALGDDVQWVLVHDAARPLVDAALIARGLAAARTHGAAIPVVPVRDTIKRAHFVDGAHLVTETVDRAQLWAAQTPQVFRAAVLRDAFSAAGSSAATFTDDASLVESLGHPVAIFDGAHDNVKITFPEDVALVEALLRRRATAAG